MSSELISTPARTEKRGPAEDAGFGECRLRTGRDTLNTRCVRVLRTEAAGVKIGQRFWHLVARAERVGMGKGLSPFLNFWCTNNKRVGISSKRQVVVV